MNQPYVVYYVLEGMSRVRTFPSKAIMDRWITKFHRENGTEPDGDNWIDLVLTGVETLRLKNNDVKLIRWGE